MEKNMIKYFYFLVKHKKKMITLKKKVKSLFIEKKY